MLNKVDDNERIINNIERNNNTTCMNISSTIHHQTGKNKHFNFYSPKENQKYKSNTQVG